MLEAARLAREYVENTISTDARSAHICLRVYFTTADLQLLR
jgi:hypothetical protein